MSMNQIVHASDTPQRSLIRRRWTDAQVAFLAENFHTIGAAECARRLGRSPGTVRGKASLLGLTSRNRIWNEQRDAILRQSFEEHGAAYCADRIGVSLALIYNRTRQLGLFLDRKWTASEDLYLTKHYHSLPNAKLSKTLGRGKGAIQKRVKDLGLVAKRVLWTAEQDQYVRDNFRAHGAASCAQALNRTSNAVAARAAHLGLTSTAASPWTLSEDKYLIDNYATMGLQACVDHLGRTQDAVRVRARALRLGLHSKCRPVSGQHVAIPDEGISAPTAAAKSTSWSSDHDQYLRDNYHSRGATHCAEALQRTYPAVVHRAFKLFSGANADRKARMDEVIRAHFVVRGVDYCAEALGVKRNAIYSRARTLGISSPRGPWLSHEDRFIVGNYGQMRVAAIAAHLGRSPKAVGTRASALGVTREARPWTDAEDAFLKANYRLVGLAACTAKLERTAGAIKLRARHLGL